MKQSAAVALNKNSMTIGEGWTDQDLSLIHIYATGNGMKITTADATLQALGIADFDVTNDFDLTQVDDALARVSAGRSGMGAQSNALEYAYRYSTNTRLNVTAGKSRLEDCLLYTSSFIIIPSRRRLTDILKHGMVSSPLSRTFILWKSTIFL